MDPSPLCAHPSRVDANVHRWRCTDLAPTAEGRKIQTVGLLPCAGPTTKIQLNSGGKKNPEGCAAQGRESTNNFLKWFYSYIINYLE